MRMRPWYLVAAMALTWFIGFFGLASGCTTIEILRSGVVPEPPAAIEVAFDGTDGDAVAKMITEVREAARLRATMELYERTFPLSVARLLLGGLLLVTSAMAMAGRPGARSLALQALAANATLTIVEYALTQRIRGAWIDAVTMASAPLVRSGPPEHAMLGEPAVWWWLERFRLVVLDLGAMGVAAVALTRQRTRIFFDAVKSAAERAEEP